MSFTAVVTGGNSGIGAAIAVQLSKMGWNVRIVCRSREKAHGFIADAARRGASSIGFIEGDFSSVASAKKAAAAIRDEAPHFKAFIHNAGMWPVKLERSAEGLEQSFMVNHLAPFILNALLEDLFRKNRCRVVQVSAGLYIAGLKDLEAAALGSNFRILKTYPTTKLFNLIATMNWARRWEGSGVTINAVHPGVVRTNLGAMSGIKGAILKAMKVFWLSPEEGARPPVMLATDEKFENLNGAYFDRFKQTLLAPIALDEEFNERVWNQAMDLSGVRL